MIQNIFSLPTYCNIFDLYPQNKTNPEDQVPAGRTVYHHESTMIHIPSVISLTGHNIAPF